MPTKQKNGPTYPPPRHACNPMGTHPKGQPSHFIAKTAFFGPLARGWGPATMRVASAASRSSWRIRTRESLALQPPPPGVFSGPPSCPLGGGVGRTPSPPLPLGEILPNIEHRKRRGTSKMPKLCFQVISFQQIDKNLQKNHGIWGTKRGSSQTPPGREVGYPDPPAQKKNLKSDYIF